MCQGYRILQSTNSERLSHSSHDLLNLEKSYTVSLAEYARCKNSGAYFVVVLFKIELGWHRISGPQPSGNGDHKFLSAFRIPNSFVQYVLFACWLTDAVPKNWHSTERIEP